MILDLSAPSANGNERFASHRRKIAGVFLVISLTVAWFPLARLAPQINRDGGTVDTGAPLAAMIGNLIALTMGIMGMTIGYMSLVHDYTSAAFTGFAIIFEVLALIPYIVDIYMIGDAASTGAAFIPGMYSPTESEVWFVGAMGMLGAGTYCLFLFGSYAFLAMAHFAYQTGKPESRNGAYYRSRLVFYCVVMGLAGQAQLMLGSFVIRNYGNGPLPAPIGVAMFMINFPEINVFVGLLHVLNSVYGIIKGLSPGSDNYFQYSMYVQWICTLVLMVGTQTWYTPGGGMAQATPTLASLTLGINLMPAFLEYMGRTIPDEITSDYYEIEGEAKQEEGPEP
mmetsp:Transcript_19277/g.29288  ORF Transcript_19277/g.29288 Transcript_19277/m.29288 type:complete len:339 (+) Transcript_19277:82-1098(+)